MTLSGGGKVKRGRISVWVFRFDGCIFIFPSVTCWCEKHDFPHFFPAHTHCDGNLQKASTKLFPYTLLTRNSSTADTEVFFSIPTRSVFLPPLPTPSNKENWKSFQFQGETTFYFYPCVLKAQILMTLTLNENEVAINYIKYDFSAAFSVQRSGNDDQVYLNVIGECLHAQPSRAFEPNFSSSVRMAKAGRMTVRGRRRNEHLRTLRYRYTKRHKKVADYEKYTTWTWPIAIFHWNSNTKEEKWSGILLWLKATSHGWGFELAVIPLGAAVHRFNMNCFLAWNLNIKFWVPCLRCLRRKFYENSRKHWSLEFFQAVKGGFGNVFVVK